MPSPKSRRLSDPIGTRLITSTPHPTATSTTPEPTSDAAKFVACCDDPHCVSTVVVGTDSGSPADSHAVRPMLKPCSPTLLTQPVTTWPIAAGIDARPLDERRLRGRQKVGGMDARQATTTAADRGANGFDDHDIGHGFERTGDPATKR